MLWWVVLAFGRRVDQQVLTVWARARSEPGSRMFFLVSFAFTWYSRVCQPRNRIPIWSGCPFGLYAFSLNI